MRLLVSIRHDPDTENPLDHDSWVLHSFGRKHVNYKDPETIGLSYSTDDWGQPLVDSVGLKRKLKCSTAFWCYYYEHGLCRWGLTGDHGPGVEFQWDGRRYAGLLIWEGKPNDLAKTPDKRREFAAAILDVYSEWCNGNTFYYCITNEHGEDIESCGGFIGSEYMAQEIASAVRGSEWELEEGDEWIKWEIEKHLQKELV